MSSEEAVDGSYEYFPLLHLQNHGILSPVETGLSLTAICERLCISKGQL